MRAACYLRSSKDRAYISLAAQRHELEKLAASRSLSIATTFEDAVESGATENRPGFLALVRAIKNPARGWTYLLVYDTSRIARRRYIAQAIKHEAKKRGVTILYAKMPTDMDPVAELVLESVFEAMDEAHSLMSREKGLAGMAENVRQGWRAGGRAPFGYDLEVHHTGAVREGRPVTKTKLVPNADAPAVGHFLQARARGTTRQIAMREAGIDRVPTTMIGVEWNALTYAGHTVWNRHSDQEAGTKRRPRAEWQIHRNTHQALITDAEAESLLAQLETRSVSMSVSLATTGRSTTLLAGLLCTSQGEPWVVHGKRHYRLKKTDERAGKMVEMAMIDRAVLEQVGKDMRSDFFLAKLLEAGRRYQAATDPVAALESQISRLRREKAKAARLALSGDAETFLPLVAERTRQIDALAREVEAIRAEAALGEQTRAMTIAQLREHLIEPAKAVETMVERIVLEPDLSCQIQYRAIRQRARWLGVASPRGFDTWPPDLVQILKVG